MPKRVMRLLVAAFCAAPLWGCESTGPVRASQDLWSQGRVEEAVTTLRDALARDPQNHRLKAAYEHERELALAHFTIAADHARGAHDVEQARALYQAALRLDPQYSRALDGLAQLDALARQDELVEQARKLFASGDLAPARARLDQVLAQNAGHAPARRLLQQIRERQALSAQGPPALKSTLDKPITLDLRDTPLRNVFDALSQTTGLNFVFDRDVRTDSKITIFIRNSSIEDVLRLVLSTNALERKILNENTVLIYPNNAAKAHEYQELTLRTFYLTNADAKQVQNLLKTMAHTKDIYVDEKLNLITIRDTPEAVRLAERLVESVDVAEAEVMLEVEVMEISRVRAQQLGLQFPTQATRGAGAGTTIPTRLLGQTITTLTNPVLVADLFSQDTDADLLANPRIRVKNREKAKILIGEKLPVFTSTAVQNAGVSTSVSYIDVGLKLEVEPQIYLDDQVGIKVNLEVNSNLGQITQGGSNPVTAYDVGTRTATTVLSLHDGETQVLAGLINDNERATLSRVPGLGDIPGIGRLFTDVNSNRDKTEIMLLITPRIIRNVVAPDFDSLVMAAGTEAQPGAAPLLIGATPPHSLAVSAAPGAPSPAPRGRQVGRPDNEATAEQTPPTPAPQAGNLSVALKAPPQASLGSSFTVSVELPDAGSAIDGDVTLGFDPSLLQAAGPGAGRASVHLGQAAAGLLVGSVTFKAVAGGAGSASIAFADGHVRLPDGTQPALSGGSVRVNIGL
jgi:general secretion pathway protein D